MVKKNKEAGVKNSSKGQRIDQKKRSELIKRKKTINPRKNTRQYFVIKGCNNLLGEKEYWNSKAQARTVPKHLLKHRYLAVKNSDKVKLYYLGEKNKFQSLCFTGDLTDSKKFLKGENITFEEVKGLRK